MATIKDVAKLAGVSFKTVSRVINRELSVGEELRERVWMAIKELDYQPNISARQLRGGASFIAFIYDNPNSHYVIDMQHGILSECCEQGFELLIHPVHASGGAVAEKLERLVRTSHIAGLVLTPPFSESSELIAALVRQNVHFVRILSASAAPDDLGPCVFVDDFQAAFDITEYLLGLGHRHIAFLGGDMAHRSSVERLNGYKVALEQHHIPADEQLVLEGQYSFDSGAERTHKLLQSHKPPSAIFASNDEIAAGALFAARIERVDVPRALSIVGFEDSPFSRQSWPKLTTAHQPNTAIAGQATRLLIEDIRRQRRDCTDEAVQRNTGFSPKLIVRDSTCAVIP